MANAIAFPFKPVEGDRYKEERVIGAESRITVRVLSRIGRPHDLIVVLDGTFEGTTTVASLPAGEFDLAEVTAQSILVIPVSEALFGQICRASPGEARLRCSFRLQRGLSSLCSATRALI